MKRILFLSFVFATSFAFAQEFTFKSNGYREKTTDKEFAVFEIEGKSQAELFKKAKIYITGRFKGLKNDGYNEVEPEQIVLDVNGTKEFTTLINFSGANVWKLRNRYEINFKDGKVMVKPLFIYLDNAVDFGVTADITTLFKKNGEVRKPKAVESVENETNEFVKELINALKSSASEDW